MIEIPDDEPRDLPGRDRNYRLGVKLSLAVAVAMALLALPVLRGTDEHVKKMKAACVEIGGALVLDKFCIFPPMS